MLKRILTLLGIKLIDRRHFNEKGEPKVDYESVDRAEKSALRMTEKYGRALEAYQCAVCGGWHIGGVV